MANCNVCGQFALGTTMCVLCAIGKAPVAEPKQLARLAGDRHRIPDAGLYPYLWLEVLLLTRVSELFKTAAGLAGHWRQIQAQVNSTRHLTSFYASYRSTELAREIHGKLSAGIINSADDAKFDFRQMKIVFNSDIDRLRISRVGGRLEVYAAPCIVSERVTKHG
jgi:hypothetical protein